MERFVNIRSSISSRFSRSPRARVMLCAAVISLSGGPGKKVLVAEQINADASQIDSALQAAATDALAGRDGAIIVMDPQTGRIRAVVNSQLAFTTPLMAGSTMKPFTALAALRSGLIDENSRTVCPGRFTGRSFSVACVHADHLPPFSPSQAIAYSCNNYFATLGERLGRDKLLETVRQFGFGQVTGVDETEPAGVLRPCETGNNALVRIAESNHVSEQSDCNAREAIGESDHIEVTPIQLLTAYAALVNGGHLFEPNVTGATAFHPTERSRINITQQQWSIITEGMEGAVRYGTARSARLDSLPLTILGKTGTALPAKGFRTNGWFVGFAGPFQNTQQIDSSKIELAVLVLLARAHGSEAAAVARPIFESYANAISSSRNTTSNTSSLTGGTQAITATRDLRGSTTSVRVHLVHDNVTQQLSLEDYVLGVMRAEATMETEPEALKALAIAIRTFALKNVGRHAKDGYDFCSTTHCQRFVASVSSPRVSKGPDGNLALTNGRATDTMIIDAVRATEGKVLLDQRGQIIDSYFSASCGGESANIGSLWGTNPPGYLRGVRDEYCLSGPHATWTDLIARNDLLRALKSDTRTDVGNRLDQIRVSKRDETGRAEFVTLEGERRKIVRGWDFKIIVGRVLGWNVLKSSRFEVSRAGLDFMFRGSGFGHGLGLCQEGGHVMAARGAGYQRILEKYFPGTSVARRDELATRMSERGTCDLNAEDAEARAEGAKENIVAAPNNLRVPLRIPQRPLRFNSLSHHATTSKNLTISSEHFRVTYPTDVDRREADQVLNALETARADYLQRASAAAIQISNLPLLEIRVNESTGDFTGRTGQPWWAAAATKGNRIELQPLAILKRRGVLTTTLRHELAHVIIDAISNNHAPRWLAEGFAIYLAGEGKMFSRYSGRSSISNAELEKRLEHPTSQENMRALYAQAYRSVTEIMRDGREAGVWKKLATS